MNKSQEDYVGRLTASSEGKHKILRINMGISAHFNVIFHELSGLRSGINLSMSFELVLTH